MGGFFGITSKCDCMMDVFFGVDYHSHLGTRRGGMAAYDKEIGLQRKIHNIENSPFRTKFEHIFSELNITDKSRVIILGDSLTSDMQGGKNAGITTCLYNPKNDKVESALCDYQIASYDEFFNILFS